MFIVGLTGMSGAGKSRVCELLGSAGIALINTDEVYHGIISGPGPCVAEIAARFGNGVTAADGSVDRVALGGIVFSSRRALDDLNAITHKYVLAAVNAELDALESDGVKAVAVEVPLLFESGFDAECSLTVGVVAPREVCVERIIKRDGITREKAEKRLARQHDEQFFRRRCDLIIENGAEGEPRIDTLLKIIKENTDGKE